MGPAKAASINRSGWGPEAYALAQQARSMSGDKLDPLVRRLQRQTGCSREACWRFIIRNGLNGRSGHRRWTDEEIEQAREDLTKYSVEEVAKKLKRTPKALRCALQRNDLRVRDIRCDCFSVDALARLLHVRKEEVLRWVDEGWLPATIRSHGRRRSYSITADGFAHLYKKHLHDLMTTRRMSNLSLFEAFFQYCYTPKHTVGEQLLDVRRDQRERKAFAQLSRNGEEDDDEDEEPEPEPEDDPDDLDEGSANGYRAQRRLSSSRKAVLTAVVVEQPSQCHCVS